MEKLSKSGIQMKEAISKKFESASRSFENWTKPKKEILPSYMPTTQDEKTSEKKRWTLSSRGLLGIGFGLLMIGSFIAIVVLAGDGSVVERQLNGTKHAPKAHKCENIKFASGEVEKTKTGTFRVVKDTGIVTVSIEKEMGDQWKITGDSLLNFLPHKIIHVDNLKRLGDENFDVHDDIFIYSKGDGGGMFGNCLANAIYESISSISKKKKGLPMSEDQLREAAKRANERDDAAEAEAEESDERDGAAAEEDEEAYGEKTQGQKAWETTLARKKLFFSRGVRQAKEMEASRCSALMAAVPGMTTEKAKGMVLQEREDDPFLREHLGDSRPCPYIQ